MDIAIIFLTFLDCFMCNISYILIYVFFKSSFTLIQRHMLYKVYYSVGDVHHWTLQNVHRCARSFFTLTEIFDGTLILPFIHTRCQKQCTNGVDNLRRYHAKLRDPSLSMTDSGIQTTFLMVIAIRPWVSWFTQIIKDFVLFLSHFQN